MQKLGGRVWMRAVWTGYGWGALALRTLRKAVNLNYPCGRLRGFRNARAAESFLAWKDCYLFIYSALACRHGCTGTAELFSRLSRRCNHQLAALSSPMCPGGHWADSMQEHTGVCALNSPCSGALKTRCSSAQCWVSVPELSHPAWTTVSWGAHTDQELLSPDGPSWSMWCAPPPHGDFSGSLFAGPWGHVGVMFPCELVPLLGRWWALVMLSLCHLCFVILGTVWSGAVLVFLRRKVLSKGPWPNCSLLFSSFMWSFGS